MKKTILLASCFTLITSFAATVVDVTGTGAQKISVDIKVANNTFASSLRRNLELSGIFTVQAQGAITVEGNPASGVTADGLGKVVTAPAAAGSDATSIRMAARKLSDSMCEAYGKQKGFACDRIAFVHRKGPNNAELCVCYPDGFDAKQLTSDAVGVVGPRWKDANHLYYTLLKNGPQIYEYDLVGKSRKCKWSLKGLATGAAVSPDGSKVAMVLSIHGNPELYVVDANNNYVRLTNTKNASEGCPSWSPDGRQIVYMSDETRTQQLYIIDVATRKSRRLTSRGSQNMDPDWGKDGRIAYVSGGQVKVIHPAEGEASAKAVTADGGWQHPSWSRDGRNLVAKQGRSLFVLDTLEEGEKPKAIRLSAGNWGDPSWSK